VQSLTEVALGHVRHNRSCLEPCLRHLVTNLDQFLSEDLGSGSDSDQETTLNKDDNIPFPRMCGATFGGNGKLVCFWTSSSQTYFREGVPKSLEELRRSVSLKREIPSDFMDDHNELLTHSTSSTSIVYRPRSVGFLTNDTPDTEFPELTSPMESNSTASLVDPSSDSVHAIYRVSKKLPPSGPSLINSQVALKDISSFLPISRQLAKRYVFVNFFCFAFFFFSVLFYDNTNCPSSFSLTGPSLPEICLKNAEAAGAAGRHDLAKVWNVATVLMEETQTSGEDSWAKNPFRRKIVDSLYVSRFFLSSFRVIARARGNNGLFFSR